MQYIPIIACAAILPILCYGAYTDWKQRIIPNRVPVLVMLLGTTTGGGFAYKFISLGIMVLLLALAAFLTHQKSGGGDIKLYMALSFALGLQGLVVVLLLTIVLYTGFRVVKRVPKTERFPVCSFVAPAYAIYFAIITITVLKGGLV